MNMFIPRSACLGPIASFEPAEPQQERLEVKGRADRNQLFKIT
jgi:hypothetical protein